MLEYSLVSKGGTNIGFISCASLYNNQLFYTIDLEHVENFIRIYCIEWEGFSSRHIEHTASKIIGIHPKGGNRHTVLAGGFNVRARTQNACGNSVNDCCFRCIFDLIHYNNCPSFLRECLSKLVQTLLRHSCFKIEFLLLQDDIHDRGGLFYRSKRIACFDV